MGTTPMALVSLGALHGINPAMGWLFAVGLGLQEGSRRALWRAIALLAVGHAAAIAAAIAGAALLGTVVPPSLLRWLVGVVLAIMAFRLFFSARHPSLGGMRVNGREIAAWSFFMSSAHGAGVMVLPLLLNAPDTASMGDHMHHAGIVNGATASSAATATLLHTAGYLGVAALIAAVVYERLGLRLLRTLWVNVDAIWGGVLVVTAVFAMMR